MIRLGRFTEKFQAIVPVVHGGFIYLRKSYSKEKYTGQPDGWYLVSIKGNDYSILEPVFPETKNISFKTIKGYTYHNTIVFQNFDVARRKLNREVMAPLFLNNAAGFSSIIAIIWEEKYLFYYKPNYSDTLIYDVKNRFDQGKSIKDLKGITPELKTLFLFHDLEQKKILEDQERIKRQKELEKFKKTLHGKLIVMLHRVGAKLIHYSVSGERIIIDWELENTGTRFNSVIDAQTFRVIEAGFCMSGDDRRHSVSSMVLTAKDYDEDGDIYITRE